MSDSYMLLASYPKTGSTWLRQILCEILSPVPDADLDGSSLEWMLKAIPSFAKALPKDPPDYEILGAKRKFLKTHLCANHKRIDSIRTEIAGVVSIYRHPLDVILSSLNYARVKEEESVFLRGEIKAVETIIKDGEIDYYLDQFITEDGLPWFKGQCNGFSRYQPGWRESAKDMPYLEICYEDMVARPEEHVAKLMTFLGRDSNAKVISDVVDRSQAKTAADGAFFWKRRAFNFHNLLPESTYKAFNEKISDILSELGYNED